MATAEDEKERKWLVFRLGLVSAVFVIGFLAVIGRVYYLQTVEAESLAERAAIEWDRQVERQARRGDIVDRHGSELAVSVEVPSIFARPKLLGDPEEVAPLLAPILERSEEWVEQRLSTESPFVWLERQAHPEVAQEIEDLNLPGLGSMTEYQRYYPMGSLAGQLLGFVSIDGDGLEGVERQFDERLGGEPYQMSVTRDAVGRPMLLSDTPEFRRFEGQSLRLTIDEKIQRAAEESLAKRVEEVDAKGGYAVAMDVNSGQVLAMAKTPEFDPNRVGDFTGEDWRLGPVTDTFEPGSVFKPFVVAAALEEGVTTLDHTYDMDGGMIRVDGYPIRDIMRRDEQTTAEILMTSSNVGSYRIAQQLGRDKLYRYIQKFGFGSPTGIGLRGEQRGRVWSPDNWAEVTFANISFGQGLSTTPLQLVTGVSALANGGMLMEPSVVAEIYDRDGSVLWEDEPTMVRRVISPSVAEQMAWSMSLVTLEEGTGTAGALDHFTVAAKTGTAQQVNPETRTYDSEMWVSGYIGFAPAEDPEVAIGVFVDQPQKERYGGAVSGPVFADIAGTALSQLGVLPMEPEMRFQLSDDPPSGDEMQNRQEASASRGGGPTSPARQMVRDDYRRAVGETEVPNVIGASLRDAIEEVRRVGVVPRVSGWGRVVDQYPPPGEPVEEVEELRLFLEAPTEVNPGGSQPSAPAAGEERGDER